MVWYFQSKHQKHQAFEAELHANADRIRGVIDMGNSLIERGACAGSEDAVKVWSKDLYYLQKEQQHATTIHCTTPEIQLQTYSLWNSRTQFL